MFLLVITKMYKNTQPPILKHAFSLDSFGFLVKNGPKSCKENFWHYAKQAESCRNWVGRGQILQRKRCCHRRPLRIFPGGKFDILNSAGFVRSIRQPMLGVLPFSPPGSPPNRPLVLYFSQSPLIFTVKQHIVF